MKYVFGKYDWATLARGEAYCYLMTNGLGGFSSQTIVGSCCRNDQAVLMACTHAPNCRYNVVHRLRETVTVGTRAYPLSSQDFQRHSLAERGYEALAAFSFVDYPQWRYCLPGVTVEKTLVLEEGRNTVAITYCLTNRSGAAVTLAVEPQLQFVPKGERVTPRQQFAFREMPGGAAVESNGLTLYLKTNGRCRGHETTYCDTLYYRKDVEDGKMALGRTASNHTVTFTVEAGGQGTLELVMGLEPDLSPAAEVRRKTEAFRAEIRARAGFEEALPAHLALAAMQFISHRASTGKKTILAGFPFFEDWGRDTMLALPGCCLATGQYETARSILETFAAYCRRGLMPNLFPEGTEQPWYNTADAALLFILAVYAYEQRTGDSEFVRQVYPVMEEIVRWYQAGTDYHIHMEADGLIAAGDGDEQVTWMDVRVEGHLPTPRHGKPVEINAYWYNALRMMEQWAKDGLGADAEAYGTLADRVRQSFCEKFWNPALGCLRDVLSGTEADDQIRCNQIWAVSQPFSLLPPEQEAMVVETVYRHLYTPYGLRTLSPEDREFRPFYGGAQLDRDLAYHQGTIWPFPLGAYYLAYLKVHGYSAEARAQVRRDLALLGPALREGCIGQLPEIYDGENPVASKGCFAQAWSVGELLRVFDALRLAE